MAVPSRRTLTTRRFAQAELALVSSMFSSSSSTAAAVQNDRKTLNSSDFCHVASVCPTWLPVNPRGRAKALPTPYIPFCREHFVLLSKSPPPAIEIFFLPGWFAPLYAGPFFCAVDPNSARMAAPC